MTRLVRWYYLYVWAFILGLPLYGLLHGLGYAARIDTRFLRKLRRFRDWHAQEPTACGCVLVGQGTDTYDPLCIRPAGHPGVCQP